MDGRFQNDVCLPPPPSPCALQPNLVHYKQLSSLLLFFLFRALAEPFFYLPDLEAQTPADFFNQHCS